MTEDSVKEIIDRNKAYNCVQCAKCSSVCPVARVHDKFSPRVIAEKVLLGFDEVLKEGELWTCLTCAACNDKCPSDVDVINFVRELRIKSREQGEAWNYAHGGAIQGWMRMMSDPALKQDRLKWVTEDLKIAEKGDILYFVGCAPYFDVMFENIGVKSTDISASAVKILNHLGIIPVVLKDERCCGHDLLWGGDIESFEKLAKKNLELIKKSGAKTVITSCPECLRAFKKDYAEHFDGLDFEVIHLSEFLSDKIKEGKVEGNEAYQLDRKVTYQDPCRLGRHLDIYDEPREVINNLIGAEIDELEFNRNRSVCCGTSCWINCGQSSKDIQIEKLQEAKSKDAVLVTACPKCQIHLKCALSDQDDLDVEVEDLTVLAASALGYKRQSSKK